MRTARLRLYTTYRTYLYVLTGFFGRQDMQAVEKTERMIATSLGVKHAIMTPMGRMAIYEALRALPKRGEVIVPALTIPEVVTLVTLAGCMPVFCDLAPGTWNMDVALAKTLIGPRTVAVLVTHFYGNTNTAEALRALCDAHQLAMIEDAAQALGTGSSGTRGDMGILSFSYPKNVTSFYGGCLLTNNDDYAQAVRAQLANYPASDKGWVLSKAWACLIKDVGTWRGIFGLSSHIIRYGYRHNVQAIKKIVSQDLAPGFSDSIPTSYRTRLSAGQARAIADGWKHIDRDREHRIACARIYHDMLSGIPGVTCAAFADDGSHNYLYYPIQVADKNALQRFMLERGCDVAVQHAPNCAALADFAAFARPCPVAQHAAEGTVTLPTYRDFPLEQARRYASVVREYLHAA